MYKNLPLAPSVGGYLSLAPSEGGGEANREGIPPPSPLRRKGGSKQEQIEQKKSCKIAYRTFL